MGDLIAKKAGSTPLGPHAKDGMQKIVDPAKGMIPLTTPKQPYGATHTDLNNPFLGTNNGYGGRAPGKDGKKGTTPQNWFDTPWGQEYGEDNPEAEYTNFLGAQGAGGQDRFGNWARSLYGQMRNAYSAAVQRNPELTWRRYLKTIDGSLQNLYASQTPDQKGIGIPTQTKTILMG